MTMPIVKTPEREAKNWLSATNEREELKVDAEKLARDDAVDRAKRRKQL